ncbi:isochorismate lyase [Cellvibrio fibrivorans]|uniref:chorismate mutase n=1 Tax=Cellvibrio fibrivorans TaxID=126350 RepID=A0ABU1UYG6_9GAMM|nr:isochorismate lyase [Cellvibrio fibrivorans]MDR7090234.1 isochorismate pyruvate lyase [Cellvibrio fibrivorans]
MEAINKISPEQCISMADIRDEIDLLDSTIIQLIGKRYQYVQAAAKFKTSETAVRAPERFKAMLLRRREWAQEQGLNPDVIEKLYSDLVNYFIREEMERWQAEKA